jgi:hypothetical protein
MENMSARFDEYLKTRAHPETFALVAVLGAAGVEDAAAGGVHRLMYHTQIAENQVIDTQLTVLARNEQQLHREIGTLTRADAVVAHHGRAVPQTVASILSADRAGIQQDLSHAETLQQERPQMPVTTDEMFGGALLVTAAAVASLTVRRIRRSRREEQASASQADPATDS